MQPRAFRWEMSGRSREILRELSCPSPSYLPARRLEVRP